MVGHEPVGSDECHSARGQATELHALCGDGCGAGDGTGVRDAARRKLRTVRDSERRDARDDTVIDNDGLDLNVVTGLDQQAIQNAIDLQPRVMQAIIDAKGRPTKYMSSGSV